MENLPSNHPQGKASFNACRQIERRRFSFSYFLSLFSVLKYGIILLHNIKTRPILQYHVNDNDELRVLYDMYGNGETPK